MVKRQGHSAVPPAPGVKRVAISSWESQLTAEISAGAAGEVQAIGAKLKALSQQVHARLIELQMSAGCGVVLVKANVSEDQDMDNNSCKRCVDAEFTAGPRGKAEFSLSFELNNIEGEEEIEVSGIMEYYQSDSTKKETNGTYEDTDIREFLERAELLNAVPDPEYAGTGYRETERLRWVYGDVVREAIELVEEKKGAEDTWELGLGVGSDFIYGQLGLEY